jgi:PH domain
MLLLQTLHVLLLEECMMLLQRQGDKYLLKFHSSASSQAPQGSNESKRHFHSPIIKVKAHQGSNEFKRHFHLLINEVKAPQGSSESKGHFHSPIIKVKAPQCSKSQRGTSTHPSLR